MSLGSGVKRKPVKKYIKIKLGILKDLGIRMSDDDIEHMNSLKNEHDIDRFARDLIIKSREF